MAIRIVNACKSYGRKTEGIASTKVLNNLTMTVPQGSLYSLMGSSGCGKTTVISCLVGLTKLDSGHVFIFGSTNISNQLNKIGFMPQEVSLHNEFSVLETLTYFSRLVAIDKTSMCVVKQIKFLQNLLELPKADRRVSTLSGGQCRRLSLAVALLHEPILLLLDEPTVGADSLIRERIWEHLKYLTTQQCTTVLVTTHYIDEARRSDFVGIIKNGKLIAEKPPQILMEELQANTLEDAFLKLSQNLESVQNMNERTCITPVSPEIDNVATEQLPFHRIPALFKKNLKLLSRNIWMLVFGLLVPSLTLYTDCMAFQHDAVGLNLGVVNLDVNDPKVCVSDDYKHYMCPTDHLSCEFLSEISADSINLLYYAKREIAKSAVEAGDIRGFITFPENYTDAWISRVLRIEEEDQFWNGSVITVSLDQTNKLLYEVIITKLYEALENSAKKMLSGCGLDERNGQFSLQYSNALVGNKNMKFLDYIAPGLAMSIQYFFPLTVAIRIISEKRQGVFARYKAMGIRVWEILLAYSLSEFIIIFCQSCTLYLILHYGFSIGASILSFPKNFIVTLTMFIMQGMSALTLGLVLGILCSKEEAAALIIITTMFSNSIISGILWPREGMVKWMQSISFVLPMTLPGEALRSVMTRQWDFYHESVWKGFMVPVFYAVINILILLCSVRKR